MTDLEKRFEKALWNIYEEARTPPCNYNAGGLETAKRLLSVDRLHDGFTALYLCNRLDLTVECHVLQPGFQELFTEAELVTARRRLNYLRTDVDASGKLFKLL